ncbi:MAG: tetratricopeptide repeat protein [Gammaproteobacteria bacterium]|nr:tetratricopeptide repeat protein [Gammaproteobacteria bacterium]
MTDSIALSQLQDAARLMERGLHQAAERRCREALHQQPDLAPAHHLLAVVLANSGRLSEALTPARRALELAPEQIQALLTVAELALHLGRHAEAADHYQQALSQQPQDAGLLARLGVCRQSLGEYEAARQSYERAVAAGGEDPDLFFNLGAVLKRLSQFDAAERAHARACEMRPDAADYQLALGVLQVDVARYEQAVQTLDKVLALRPDDVEALGYKGYAQLKLGDAEGAVRSHSRQLEQRPDSAGALAGLAASSVATGKPADAVSYCDRLLTLDPANRNAWADKAIALSALGRVDEARWLVDLDGQVLRQEVDPPPGYADIGEYNAALVAHLREHPRIQLDCLSVSCHNGFTSDEILVEPMGPLQHLSDAIHAAAERYKAALALPPGHPYPAHMPSSWALSAWCTMLRTQGYQHGHIHSLAYLSGVYYLQLPDSLGADDSDRAGWIEFGRAPYWYGDGDQGEIRALRPAPGTLLLFPSYVFHRTLPFSGEDMRITIAFDFQPRG